MVVPCWSCGSKAAAYLWHTQVGNVVALCVECCAGWRANAEAEPDLAPVRIEQI